MAIKTDKVTVAKVERVGEALVVPERMTLKAAIEVLTRQAEYEETKVQLTAEFPYHPYDVAYNFGRAIERETGILMGKATFSFFSGEQPPTSVSVEVAPGEFLQVLWGESVFPFDPQGGSFRTHFNRKPNGTVVGVCIATIKQKYKAVWDRIIKQTRELLATESLFKGKTLKVQFTDPNTGDFYPVPEIKPWDVRNANINQLVFSEELTESIEDHILTPIKFKNVIEQAGTPFKRGVLLAGTYGCGKTLLAKAVAGEASRRGMTVVYIEHVSELPHAIRFAGQLAGSEGAVVFAEDVDRITDGERSVDIDTILNTLDGIDTKNLPIMTILTSNYVDRIYKGMVRPGRIDVALQIQPPDAYAAGKLVEMYLGNMLAENDPQIGETLKGLIPAVIREVAERAKLSHISRTGKVPLPRSITAEDVLRAASGMKNQISLLLTQRDEPTIQERVARELVGLMEVTRRWNDPQERIENVLQTPAQE